MSRSSGGVSIGAALVVALVAICLILGIVGLTLDEFTYYGNEDNKIATSFESYSDTAQKLHENEIEDDSCICARHFGAFLQGQVFQHCYRNCRSVDHCRRRSLLSALYQVLSRRQRKHFVGDDRK